MASLVIWMIAFTIGSCATILTAATGNRELHLGVTALVTLAIAVVAVQDYRRLELSGARRSLLAASTSRYVGLIWIWAACAMLFTYQFILKHREAWEFTVGLLVVGGLCLILASMFDRDAVTNRGDDEAMLKLGRMLNIVQVVGMAVVVVGLIADHKFPTFTTPKQDWAANNIFFFGAIAVGLIGINALLAESAVKSR